MSKFLRLFSLVIITMMVAMGSSCAQQFIFPGIQKSKLFFTSYNYRVTQHGFAVGRESDQPVFRNLFLLSPSSSILHYHTPQTLGNILPDGAIFCKMENQLHQRFGIWIKLRAGDDDTYQKVMATGK